MLERLEFNGLDITPREDGFFNLTAMCKAGNKNVADFLRLDSTKAYFNSFLKLKPEDSFGHMGNPTCDQTMCDLDFYLRVSKGGKEKGTWAHPEIAVKCAAWVNSDLEVLVYRAFTKMLRTGTVSIADIQSDIDKAIKPFKEENEVLKARTEYLDNLTDELASELEVMRHENNQMKYFVEEADVLGRWKQENSWT